MNDLMEVVIQATEGTIDKINDGNNEVERSNTAFNRIEKNIKGMGSAIQSVQAAVGNIEGVANDMAAGTQEQSASTANVLEHCEQILTISRKFSAEGQEMADSSRQLRELSEQLDVTVSRFKIEKPNGSVNG
jgi:methyl-accepting chemotaxis protein